MSFSAQSVISRARLVWKESASGDILSDANCLLWLSDGILEMRSLRPESLRFTDDLEPVDFAEVSTVNYSIPIDVKFRSVLVDYLIARGFMGDADSQNHDARANAHFKLFYDRIKVV